MFILNTRQMCIEHLPLQDSLCLAMIPLSQETHAEYFDCGEKENAVTRNYKPI